MSKYDETKCKVYNILKELNESEECELKFEIDQLTDDTSVEEIGFNSITYIQMIVSIEDMFDIEFDDAMLDYNMITTIGEFIKIVNDKVNLSEYKVEIR